LRVLLDALLEHLRGGILFLLQGIGSVLKIANIRFSRID
jgi:hypothetical protein